MITPPGSRLVGQVLERVALVGGDEVAVAVRSGRRAWRRCRARRPSPESWPPRARPRRPQRRCAERRPADHLHALDREHRQRERDPLEGVQRRRAGAGAGQEEHAERDHRPGARGRRRGTFAAACGRPAAPGSSSGAIAISDRPQRERVLARLARQLPRKIGAREDHVVQQRRAGEADRERPPARDATRYRQPPARRPARRRSRAGSAASPCHGCSRLATAPSTPGSQASRRSRSARS